MLKKEHRLSSVLLKNSKVLHLDFFSLRVSTNQEAKNRFAFVVSKRIDKRAVVRNEVKRKVRSVIEQIFDNIEKGHDFVFYPKLSAKEATREQILEEIKNTLTNLKLLK